MRMKEQIPLSLRWINDIQFLHIVSFSLRFLPSDATVEDQPGMPSSGGVMVNSIERRSSRRFTMTLPLTVRANGPDGGTERQGQTRDVSFRGLYFLIDADFESGSSIEFVLTLPREITMAGDVHIRCYAQIIRVEPHNGRRGIAARIDRYEFLPASAPV